MREFTAGLDRQQIPPDQVEVVIVDTGSADETLPILRDWARATRFEVTIIPRPNASIGAARNVGIDHASGEWLTFPDLRDRWDEGYLAAIDRFRREHRQVQLIAGRPMLVDEARAQTRDGHRRRWQYVRIRPVVDLESTPNAFAVAAASFFRHETIRHQGLTFDGQLRPFFEDSHFAARYLLGVARPLIGLVRGARYLQLASVMQELQRAIYADEETYTTILERGLLDLLERGRTTGGNIRPWIQQIVIDELAQTYFREAEAFSSRLSVPAPVEDRFHHLLGAIAERLDPQVVVNHTATRLDPVWVDILIHGYRDRAWFAGKAELTDIDTETGLQRLKYRFHGPVPVEDIRIDGQPATPAVSKRRTISYFGGAQLFERILWLPIGDIRLSLNGASVPVVKALGSESVTRAPAGDVLKRGVFLGRRALLALRKAVYRVAARLLRGPFRDAWVLIDRVHDAGDNGQRLFEYLRRERPDINAWFVVAAGTPDWERLRARGERRLVAYGTWRWKMLMLNAAWLLSSHTDGSTIIAPRGLRGLVSPPPWKYAFLQHGVVHRDLSRWFNKRHIDLMVTSTAAERLSMAADGTSYILTTKEVRETGLPRFDRLLTLAQAVAIEERNLVVIAPTWRTWLTIPSLPGKGRRPIHDEFWRSEFLRRWLELLRDERISVATQRRGWRLAFMPHPNFQAVLSEIDLPANIERLSFTRHDAQAVYARCALMVTDYSSVAFDAAYIERPVVYYQFDREDLETGRHHGRSGYFDYERDGFGPVTRDLDEVVGVIVTAIERGPSPAPKYQRRMDHTFPIRDGGACARVVASVEELSRPWPQQVEDEPSATRSQPDPIHADRGAAQPPPSRPRLNQES